MSLAVRINSDSSVNLAILGMAASFNLANKRVYLLVLALSELNFQSGSPSSEVSLFSLMTNTSMPLAFSSTFLTSLAMVANSRLLRSSSMAYS